jgi:hypothetical protein
VIATAETGKYVVGYRECGRAWNAPTSLTRFTRKAVAMTQAKPEVYTIASALQLEVA